MKRYRIQGGGSNSVYPEEDKSGDYVKFDDISKELELLRRVVKYDKYMTTLLTPCHGTNCPLKTFCKRAIIGIVMGGNAEKLNLQHDDDHGCEHYIGVK